MAEKSVSTDSLGIEKEATYAGKKFRIAFIGCGGIAQTHIAALRTMPDVEIIAGVDIDPARLKQMDEVHKFPGIYKDWKQMLKTEKPDAVSAAFIQEQAAQCGYCIAGMMMRAQALLEQNPSPSSMQVRQYMSANLCRCGTHMRILRAIDRAGALMRETGTKGKTT